jgi:hypothetical protein
MSDAVDDAGCSDSPPRKKKPRAIDLRQLGLQKGAVGFLRVDAPIYLLI